MGTAVEPVTDRIECPFPRAALSGARCENLVVAYYLTFFCRSGQENGSSALETFLSKLAETGVPGAGQAPCRGLRR